MKNKLLMYVFLSLLFVGLGCASKQFWRADPNLQQASNEYYAATISPIYIFDGYKGFMLYIHNKSTEALEVDWKKTFYIYNGKKTGSFIFGGMRSGDRVKTPNIVSGSLFSKEIFPAKLARYSTLAQRGSPQYSESPLPSLRPLMIVLLNILLTQKKNLMTLNLLMIFLELQKQ